MPDGSGVQALLHRLEPRLAAWRVDGDAEALWADAAFKDAERLHCALARAEEDAGTDPADLVPAWSALAQFHEARKDPPDGADTHLDFYRAVYYHCLLYRQRPDLVPQQHRRAMDDHPEMVDVMGAAPWTCVERVTLMAQAFMAEEGRQHPDDSPLGTTLGQLVAQALALIPPAHPLQLDLQAALGFVAFSYFCRTNDDNWLSQAVDLTEQALNAMSVGHPLRDTALNDLSIYLRRAAHRRGDADLLARAAAAVRESLETTPVGTSEYAMTQITYANVLQEQHAMVRSADHALLDEAESMTRAAVDSGCLSPRDQAKALSNLGSLLETQYERTGRVALLEESLEVSRRALDISDERDEQYPTCRVNLGIALLALAHVRRNAPDLLREAEEQLAGGLEALVGDEHRAYALSALGAVRQLRGARPSGASTGRQDPVDLHREAVDALPEDHPDRASGLLNLAGAVVGRHLELGDAASWRQHVELLRRMARVPGRDRATGMVALAQALTWQDPVDDDAWSEAEELLRDVVEGGWALLSDVRSATVILARLLRGRFEAVRDDEMRTLQAAAIGAALQAVEDGYPLRDRPVPPPPASDGRPLMLGMGDAGELDRAIALLRATRPPEGDTGEWQSGHLHELSSALHRRYLHDDDIGLLHESVSLCREARRLADEGTEEAALVETTLASHLRDLHRDTSGRGALAEAADLFRSAATTPTAGIRVRLNAACNWAESAEALGYSEQAPRAYDTALDLLELASWSGIDQEGQEALLRRADGLARDAAAQAVGRREYERAVEVLEHGRGVLLGRALGGQAAVHRVARVSPELAERFANAHAQAEALPVPDEDGYGGVLSTGERLAAARRRSELIEEIRKQEGLADFLRRPSYPALREAAADGPVVIVNASRSRCDALIVRADRDVRCVPLDDVSDDLVRSYARRFSLGLGILEGDAPARSQLASGRHLVMTTLEWLWHQVCAPILTELGHTQAKSADEAERVWWCPTGAFAALPLHAAGLHDRQRGDAQSVLDRVISSYTPTLRQLIEVRSAPAASPGRPLLVAVPETQVSGGQHLLRTAEDEAQVFLRSFPTAHALIGPDATGAAVRGHLPTAGWVHFACHGSVRGASDDEARLLLYDEELRMAAVSRTSPARNAELAFLSACSTARTVRGLSDESLNLATMMQLAGYRHVIGTLWAIDDPMAPAVADTVYTALARPTGEMDAADAARSLHRAVLEQRRLFPMASVNWCSYVHLGP
ncbi:CHAT domain-containing protein [Streptomyces sp. NPDC048254]|uniref:CHAT domain-containing protein n=1 Tax=Streptomyces sp. NPDC048254 TaxID=3365525 RepID=UPI00371CE2F8